MSPRCHWDQTTSYRILNGSTQVGKGPILNIQSTYWEIQTTEKNREGRSKLQSAVNLRN